MGKINKSTEKTTFDGADYIFGWLSTEAEGQERKWKLSTIAAGISTYLGITNFGSGKIITDAERTKLNGISTGAQVNTVTSVLGRTGAVVAAASDYDANQVDYDNTLTPALSSPTNVQAAIEGVYARTELSQDLTPVLGGDLDPSTFAYAGSFKHTGSTVGFFGTTPITKPTSLTAKETALTQVGTPIVENFNLPAFTNTTPFGFVTADDAETFLQVVINMQTRIDELETKLVSLGLIA